MRRALFHDYRSRSIYHITINKAKVMPLFGHLTGGVSNPKIEKSRLGLIIERNIRAIGAICPKLRLLQYIIMPDHVHFLLFATEPLELPVGKYISMLKIRIGQEWRLEGGEEGPIFIENFYDRIISRKGQLDVAFRYIRENPRRLAVRRARPEFFRRVNGLDIGGRRYAAYGNIYLLRNPFCEQVVVHRRDSEAERAAKRERWLHAAANGGVLVSPFISPAEKAIRSEAEALNAKIILITNEAMPERYKPAAHDFALCEAGRLLIISLPMEISRAACLAMNTLAATISEGEAGEGV
ncbi:MAG: hypothetical protein K2L92_09120 [Muribaculaceae bacterium]|nr:hypothetical protein [Muribaculaceae bacterium]